MLSVQVELQVSGDGGSSKWCDIIIERSGSSSVAYTDLKVHDHFYELTKDIIAAIITFDLVPHELKRGWG